MKTPRHKSPKRRLAIEPVESRLMLSGDGVQNLNTNNYNLDQIGVDYAVFSDVDSSSFQPMLDGNLVQDSAGSGDEPPSVPRAYVVDRPQFNFTDAIFRDMAARVNEAGTGVALGNTSYNGDYRAEVIVTGLDYVFAPQFAVTGLSKFDWTLRPSDNVLSHKLLSQDRLSLASVFDAGLQLSAGDTQALPGNEAGTPTIADRLGGYVSQIGAVEVPVSVDIARPVEDANWFVITPTAPANTVSPIRNSDAQIDVGRVFDELINSGGGFVDYGVQDGLDASDAEGVLLTDSDATPQADGRFNVPAHGDRTKLVGAEPFDEGGMIAVQGIVGQVAAESLTPPAVREVIATDAPAEITGELARVAVMELIEGQQDPTAPESAADHTYLVAMDDVSFTLEQISLVGYRDSSAALAAVSVIADQAGLVASLVTPASPIQLAAVVSAASDAFASAAMSAPPAAVSATGETLDDARSEAFSQWEDTASLRADDERSGHSSYGLVLSALAVERVVASRRKKRQRLNAAAGPPLPVG